METDTEVRPSFSLLEIAENRNGWGPVTGLEKFQSLPYQQFNKADKIGKVADWMGITQFNDRFRRKFSAFSSKIILSLYSA